MKSSIVFIANPIAKNASFRKIERAAAILVKRGFAVDTFLTRKKGDAEHFARQEAEKGRYCIIVGGGDGTINEVLNGITGSDVPLALLPMGTTNVLAKELGVPEDISGAIDFALSRQPRVVSLGKIDAAGQTAPRYFCLMTGIGLDGKAVHDVSGAIKKMSGKAAYILSGLWNILLYSPDELRLRIDGLEYKGYGAIVCKASKYGGHFRIAPEARLADPFLYTCIFKGRRRRDLIRYALGIISGRHLKFDDVVYVKSSEVEIQGRAHMQIDGDYFGLSPAKISVAKDVVKIIY